MTIRSVKNKHGTSYSVDDKMVSRDGLAEICKKFLTATGLAAMWQKVIIEGECVIDLDIDCDENKILAKKNAELEEERNKNALLEKKLMQCRIKAAKYDGMMSAMRNKATV